MNRCGGNVWFTQSHRAFGLRQVDEDGLGQYWTASLEQSDREVLSRLRL